MGAKHVCFTCRKAFNTQYDAIGPTTCPDCGQAVAVLNQRFRPPKKREVAKWEVAKYLLDHRFYYHPVYANLYGGQSVKYPENMQEAKEFVVAYRHWAIKQ